MCLGATIFTGQPALADGLPDPSGPVILEVEGRIGNTNRDGTAVFDLAMLEDFGGTTLVTGTPWTEGVVTFEGISGARLLELIEPAGDTVTALALNDYSAELPVSDFREMGLLLAYKLDGEPMSVREKGPLWIVFPYEDIPEDQQNSYQARSVWQLKRLTFE